MDLYPWIIPGLPPCLLKTAGRWRPACCSSRAWIIGTGSILFKLLGRDRARAGNEPGAQSSAQMKPQQLARQGGAQGWVFQAQKAFPRPVLAPCAPVLFTAKAFGGIRTRRIPVAAAQRELRWHKHFWSKIWGNWADFTVLVAPECVHIEQQWWDEAALLKMSYFDTPVLVLEHWKSQGWLKTPRPKLFPLTIKPNQHLHKVPAFLTSSLPFLAPQHRFSDFSANSPCSAAKALGPELLTGVDVPDKGSLLAPPLHHSLVPQPQQSPNWSPTCISCERCFTNERRIHSVGGCLSTHDVWFSALAFVILSKCYFYLSQDLFFFSQCEGRIN